VGVIGGILGISFAWLVGNVINNMHLSYTPPSSQEVPLYIKLSLNNGIKPFLIVLFATTLSAIYPALKASRLKIVEMLRHV
jgi:putative ABC transport system permease protein